jgi:hypothetical protein
METTTFLMNQYKNILQVGVNEFYRFRICEFLFLTDYSAHVLHIETYYFKDRENDIIIIIIMALQPFVGPWPLFQFLDHIHSRQDSLDGGSARHKVSTYTQNNKNASSGIRTDDSSVQASEDSSCLRPRGHCDQRENYIYRYHLIFWQKSDQLMI